MTAGTRAAYRYFDLRKTRSIRVQFRGTGVICANGNTLDANGCTPLTGTEKTELILEVLSGKVDILSFELRDHE